MAHFYVSEFLIYGSFLDYQTQYAENKVKLTLLPNKRVKVTADGISFHHAFYVNERAIKEEWLLKKDKVLDISYDPRNISKIYIKDRNYKNGYEVAYLTGHSSRYKNKTFQEVQQLFKTEKLLKADLKELQMQSKMDFYNGLAEIGEEAEAQTKAAQEQGISNNKKLKGVRKNKANEKRYGEYNDAFDLSDTDEGKKEINPSELNQVVDDSNKALDSRTHNNEDDYLEALKNQSEEFYNESGS